MTPKNVELSKQIEYLRKKLHGSTMHKPGKLANHQTYQISKELDKLIYKMMTGKK